MGVRQPGLNTLRVLRALLGSESNDALGDDFTGQLWGGKAPSNTKPSGGASKRVLLEPKTALLWIDGSDPIVGSTSSAPPLPRFPIPAGSSAGRFQAVSITSTIEQLELDRLLPPYSLKGNARPRWPR